MFATRTPVACDGSVRELELSVSATINPSITAEGTFTDYKLDGSQFGWAMTTGIAGFDPGAWLEGAFEMTSIFPNQLFRDESGFFVDDPIDPIRNVTVPNTLESLGVQRDYYFYGLVDVGSAVPFDDALLLRTLTKSEGETAIPHGTDRTDFATVATQPFQCPSCSFISTGLRFASPGRGGVADPGYVATRTKAGVTFRIFEVPGPTVIPLPAAGWLLLGGLGALAAVGHRRRRMA